FSDRVLNSDIKKYFNDDDNCKKAFDYIKSLYKKYDLKKLNESQLEDEFIKPILTNAFEYKYINQKVIIIHGEEMKPDYILFSDDDIKNNYINNENIDDILLVFEAKSWGLSLDSKKIKESPHRQLVRYNLFLGIRYGILSNGKEWRLYDLKDKKSEKIFFEINLENIINDDNYEAFEYFYYIFRKKFFVLEDKEKQSNAQKIAALNEETINEIEEDLKNVIYGDNSIIEKIGQVLYKSYSDESLDNLFNHSIMMAYRLLFIAYFETKYESQLFAEHEHYKSKALFTLYKKLEEHYSTEEKESKLKAYQELCELFDILDKGSIPFHIPLLNGGLFDVNKAPLFEYKRNKTLFSNDDVYDILKELLQIRDDKNKINIRNFSIMSVTHIGNIYEGLLQYTFRHAAEKKYYLEYRENKEKKSGYFEIYDYEEIKKNKNITVDVEREIKPNSIYLVNSSNSRKMSASYYTPASLSNFMVHDAVNIILQNEKYKNNILSLKVLDNACGSGHFLVDFLDALTENIYSRIFKSENENGDFYYLYDYIMSEKEKIKDNLSNYNLEDMEIDELQILKRILLKKVIYGVDINYFSVELTRLSLWLKTFIFGTPLSFIEHHIKEGNSLIGSTIEEGQKALSEYYENEHNQRDLFSQDFRDVFADLKNVSEQLSSLPDSTTEEIEKSKEIYINEILPKQRKLSSILDLVTYKKLKESLKKKKDAEVLSIDPYTNLRDIEHYNSGSEDFKEVLRVARKYKFFNYDIEFPESYNYGFDIIIGNPPWDKVKLDDKDFFSQYRSNYRTMKNNEKKHTQDNLLKYYKEIKEEYEDTNKRINTILSYYGDYYPLNEGAGDTNLFRLFIERNISLISMNGSLIYVTPSAWSYEEGSINIRKHIFDSLYFRYFYQFENKKAIFHDVHRSYKFAVWSVKKEEVLNKDYKVPCFFMEHDAERLYKEENKNEILYPLDFSRKYFEDTYMMPEIENNSDINILEKMYSIGKRIDREYIDFYRELDMTNDKDIFLEKRNNDEMPLYEGKMVWQFNSKFEEAQYFVDEEKLKERLFSKEVYRMVDNLYNDISIKEAEEKMKSTKIKNKNSYDKTSKENKVMRFINIGKKEDFIKYIVYDYTFPRLAFRDISGNTNERTLISSIIPSEVTAGNTLWLSNTKKYYLEDKNIKIKSIPFKRLLWVNALLNSIVIDYIIRLYVDIHVNKTYLMKLPLIHASDEELDTEPYKTICDNAFALSLYNNKELAAFYSLPDSFDLPQNSKDYDMLQIQNDIMIAKLYSITFNELSNMLKTFKVLNDKKPHYVKTLLHKAENVLQK
ncbi:Eco57I restriction-modification methylase domain-containing protein, partial [Brachyspira hampsonii]|uniref:Eco57I restriction-modification methylase domain-containing protein n=1 Tax=Brachyspira hampsonii TaxID=1287055 RepID=UPI001CA5BA7C